MAAGSEKFAFKRHPDIPKVCNDCGKPLRVIDVGEVRIYPERWYRCNQCWRTAYRRLYQETQW